MFTKFIKLVACGRGHGTCSCLSTHSHSWLPTYQQSSILLIILSLHLLYGRWGSAPSSKLQLAFYQS